MVRRALCFLTVLAVVVVAACSGGNSVVGKWKMTGISGMPPGVAPTITFESGDKFAWGFDMDLGSFDPNMKGTVTTTVSGTYKLTGNTMALTPSDVQFKFTGVDPAIEGMMKQAMEGQKAQMMDQMKSSSGGEITWVSKDKFTVKGPKETATFERM